MPTSGITKKVREKLVRRTMFEMLREYAPTSWKDMSDGAITILVNLLNFKTKSKRIKELRELCKKHYNISQDIQEKLKDIYYTQFKRDFNEGDEDILDNGDYMPDEDEYW